MVNCRAQVILSVAIALIASTSAMAANVTFQSGQSYPDPIAVADQDTWTINYPAGSQPATESGAVSGTDAGDRLYIDGTTGGILNLRGSGHTFVGIIALRSGTINISSASNLPTPLGRLNFLSRNGLGAGASTLQVAAGSNALFDGAFGSRQRMIVQGEVAPGSGREGIISLLDGATFTVQDSVYSGQGGGVRTSGGGISNTAGRFRSAFHFQQ